MEGILKVDYPWLYEEVSFQVVDASYVGCNSSHYIPYDHQLIGIERNDAGSVIIFTGRVRPECTAQFQSIRDRQMLDQVAELF